MIKYFLSITIILFPFSAMTGSEIKPKNINGKNTITLTQIPCQFLESEEINKNFKAASKNDCIKINERTKVSRIAKKLVLKPGKYTFKVINAKIPYPVGFYLRGTGLHWVTLPRINGEGIVKGKSKSYTVDLKPGEYYYSCPFNPTPDYTLRVEN
jgi:hypothetical protein